MVHAGGRVASVEIQLLGRFKVRVLAGTNAWYHLVKPLVARDRPPQSLHLIGVSGFAFPSGHATAAIAVWGAVAVVLSLGRQARMKAAIWICAGLVATLVSFSRVYLGVHWWTDVVAGMALGGTWLCLLVALGTLIGRAKAMEFEPNVDIGRPLIDGA